MREDIITGLDIGSTNIRVAVGQMVQQTEGHRLQIIGAAEGPSEGISKGSIVSIEDAVSSISRVFEKVERMTGIPVEHAYISILGPHITSQDSHGVVAVAKADGEIREEDVERVVEAAQTVSTPPNYEILHVLPHHFSVDNQKNIKDPVGMTGIKLEVNAQIIQGLSAQIKNLTKCIYRTGADIDDLVFGVLAAAQAVLTKRQKELGVALVNIGATTTGLVVFEEGDVLHTKVLPIGAGHITNDIAIGLRTSIDVAEAVKLQFGSAMHEGESVKGQIDLSKIDENEDAVIARKTVVEIVEARIEEIFTMLNKELKSVKRDGLLPAGVVLTGGGAKLPDITAAAKKYFRLPSSVGVPRDLETAIDKIEDPAFSTAAGLVQWGANLSQRSGHRGHFSLGNLSSVSHVTSKMQQWFKSLLP
ncbi:MAG: cell division protein FtsA [Candidatus Kerfeldbacteria bacterium RIFCSPHIGHO2_12_FULL_48_17]|uniref:Cell division protein FtsA n=1 Tax=Candidatus Kerfeldbacteria bacterium RIFCSPHIGHO2_12_FULL_48_17 TaxID=1798542 RepID=A0A1G2B3C8_9BACT|nr:MAG: cell division protein FtsA [Candidatus Kerfeldbacteria bacterium RIFCSPHIGHO2_12_FULL_48_17]